MKVFDKNSHFWLILLISALLVCPAYSQSLNQDLRSFFETGRLSSEDRLRFESPPSGVTPVQENSRSWQFIIYKQGGVSFWMPPGVLTDESVILETPLGEIPFRSLSSNTDDRRFVAAYAPFLTQEQLIRPNILLQAIENKVAPSEAFKLVANRSLRLDKFPGIELQWESEEEGIILRAYLIDRRAYVMGVRYPKSQPEERQTRAFLNALQLLDNAQ